MSSPTASQKSNKRPEFKPKNLGIGKGRQIFLLSLCVGNKVTTVHTLQMNRQYSLYNFSFQHPVFVIHCTVKQFCASFCICFFLFKDCFFFFCNNVQKFKILAKYFYCGLICQPCQPLYCSSPEHEMRQCDSLISCWSFNF